MRFAVDVPNFGDFADPRVVADLARRAEDAGWDGLFVWDHVTHRKALRWWAECLRDDLEHAEPMLRRVDQGPPPR
jgi:alkanesulfonate monooxygenase SsuD/methylene tetrahydromethanopterin reductase-like flavin-dependent oxidoreductase (luciferase family)